MDDLMENIIMYSGFSIAFIIISFLLYCIYTLPSAYMCSYKSNRMELQSQYLFLSDTCLVKTDNGKWVDIEKYVGIS